MDDLVARRREWETEHQPFERRHWLERKPDALYENAFVGQTQRIAEMHGVDWTSRTGQTIIDIGCGPYPLALAFEGAKVICIDPLLEDYMTLKDHRLKDPRVIGLYPQPAEEYISDLEGVADLAFSNNALDHTYDWHTIVANAVRYLKPGGEIFFRTRAGRKPTIGHPGIPSLQALVDCCTTCLGNAPETDRDDKWDFWVVKGRKR